MTHHRDSASPSSQRTPVQPRPQLQLPVAASHLLPWLQAQRWRQPTPNQPGGQSGIRTARSRTRHRYRCNRCLRRLTVSTVLSPASRPTQAPPAHRVVGGPTSTRRRLSAVRPVAPGRTGWGQGQGQGQGRQRLLVWRLHSSPDGGVGLTGVAARSYEPWGTLARPGGGNAPPAVLTLAVSVTARPVTSFLTS